MAGKNYEKPYVRPVVLGCYGKDGCPIPAEQKNGQEAKRSVAKDAKGEGQKRA